MSSRKRRERRNERAAGSSRPASQRRLLAALGVLAVAVALSFAVWRSRPGSVTDRTASAIPPPPASTPGPPAPPEPAPPAITASDTPEPFRPLLGEWLRPDGGYVLSLTGVAKDGRAAVAYFNPRPIRVARAEARREGDLVGLFVEFADVGYPGSTYSLAYDAASGQLKGLYYQAVQRQQYEVVFVRRR